MPKTTRRETWRRRFGQRSDSTGMDLERESWSISYIGVEDNKGEFTNNGD